MSKKKKVLGDRKLIKGSLAEYSNCITCKKNFWAETYLEEGNFLTDCPICIKRKKTEYGNKLKLAKEFGEKDLSAMGKVKGWRYGGEYYICDDFIPNAGKVIKKIYSASLSFGDLIFYSEGDTILECLEGLNFNLTKTAGILKVRGEGKQAERVMYPMHLKRLLVNKVYRQILQKQLLFLMK